MDSHNNQFPYDHPSSLPQSSGSIPVSNSIPASSMGPQIIEPQPQDVVFATTFGLLKDLGIPVETAPQEFHSALVSNFLLGKARYVQMPECVKELQDKAQHKYRHDVEVRKRKQLQNHRMDTGHYQPTAAEMRKYTNRATAGAGKTKAQDLLKELIRFGNDQTEYSQKLISFLLRALQESAIRVRELEQRLDQNGGAPPAMSEPVNTQGQVNFPEQFEGGFEQGSPLPPSSFLTETPEVVRNTEDDRGNISFFSMADSEQPPSDISKPAELLAASIPELSVQQGGYADGAPHATSSA